MNFSPEYLNYQHDLGCSSESNEQINEMSPKDSSIEEQKAANNNKEFLKMVDENITFSTESSAFSNLEDLPQQAGKLKTCIPSFVRTYKSQLKYLPLIYGGFPLKLLLISEWSEI